MEGSFGPLNLHRPVYSGIKERSIFVVVPDASDPERTGEIPILFFGRSTRIMLFVCCRSNIYLFAPRYPHSLIVRL